MGDLLQRRLGSSSPEQLLEMLAEGMRELHLEVKGDGDHETTVRTTLLCVEGYQKQVDRLCKLIVSLKNKETMS